MDASAPPPALKLIWDEITIWGPTSIRSSPFDEEMVVKEPTLEQMREIEKVWVAAPAGQRLEVVAAKCKELGIEIVSMRRKR